MRNSDRSTIQYEVLRGKWLLFRKKSPRLNGVGQVGSESTDFDFLHNISCQSVLFLLYNPRAPMRGFASLKGNTFPVKNVINGVGHARIFIYKWLCKNKNSTEKHILGSAANIKFTCKLYLVAIYILLKGQSHELRMRDFLPLGALTQVWIRR